MLVSMRWLARHVDLSGVSPEQLCDDLTLSTAEVEGLEPFAPALRDVVVGHVLDKAAHPGADKLSLCRVDVGAEDPLSIVCGAPNVAAGQRVAVARIGTRLPGGLEIRKSKIRGEVSQGMICSVAELGVGEAHDGIWVLPEGAKIGRPVAEALDLEDWVLEIDNKSLTHRPDLWGHRGLAREVAAIYQQPMRPLDTSLPPTGDAAAVPVVVETAGCSRYVALPIDGVSPGPSPDWLRWLLLAVGQRPIDLLVDLSNFVMLDLGQPNHVFDRSRIDALSGGRGIVVRAARGGEALTTLDGERRELRESDLLICAGDEPVALAGIMGGEESKVAPDTQSLLLEVAHFDATTIRRTSSRLGLRTDSSARFEKSLDPHLPADAAGHFARLLQEIEPGARLPSPATDVGAWSDPSRTLALRPDRLRTALGKDLPDREIRDILERLGFGVAPEDGILQVAVPSHRATKDVTIEQDLIEEVGRIHRYGRIDERPLRLEIAPPPRDERRRLVRQMQDRLAGGARFHENLSYSFVDDDLLGMLGEVERPHVSVINPVVRSQSRIRRHVAPSLLPALAANRRHRDDVRLFEIGKAYEPEHATERGEPRERHYLALAWAGEPPGRKTPWDADRLLQMRGIVDDLVRARGLAAGRWHDEGEPPPWAHPHRCLFLQLEGVDAPAGVIASLDPALAGRLGLAGDLASEAAVGELCLDALLAARVRERTYEPLPRFPGIKIDVAVAVPEAVRAGEIVAAIESAGRRQIASIELFDVYRGGSIGAGRKSLAFHVLLQAPDRTLTEKDEQKFLQRFDRLVREAGGELRSG